MYAKPGSSSFNTLFIGNGGTKTLRLTGGSFSGPGAGSFRLLRGEFSGPANQPWTFPTSIGANGEGGQILYITCDRSVPEGTRSATFTLTTDDPARPSMSWPVSCLVDGTPPSPQFTSTPQGRAGWHVAAPARVTVTGIDPESGNRVKAIDCTDSNGPALHFGAGSVARFDLTAQGTHNLACQGTDVANNTGAVGAYKTSVWSPADTTAPAISSAVLKRQPADLQAQRGGYDHRDVPAALEGRRQAEQADAHRPAGRQRAADLQKAAQGPPAHQDRGHRRGRQSLEARGGEAAKGFSLTLTKASAPPRRPAARRRTRGRSGRPAGSARQRGQLVTRGERGRRAWCRVSPTGRTAVRIAWWSRARVEVIRHGSAA